MSKAKVKSLIAKRIDRVMEAHDLTQFALAGLLRVSRLTVNQISTGRRRITPDMALRLERLTGQSAWSWLRMQGEIDLERARWRYAKSIARIKRLRRRHG